MKLLVSASLASLSLLAASANVAADGLPPCPLPSGITTITMPRPIWGERSPVWSPHGARLALVNVAGDSTVQIADADSHKRRSLGPGGEPTWSPDGSKIALVRTVAIDFGTCEGYGPAIFITSADGRSSKRLVNLPQESDSNPVWSPDGARIAYSFANSTESGLAVVPVGGGPARVLTSHLGGDNTSDYDLTWSPRGRMLAFTRFAPGTPGSRIWVMNADGSNPHPLTALGRFDEGSPSWAPGGGKLVFTRSDVTKSSVESGVWVSRLNGSGVRQLSRDTYVWGEGGPVWSPDGRSIAFDRSKHNASWVYTMRADGSDIRKVGLGSGPVWSADGSQLAFVRWPRDFNHLSRIWVASIKPLRGAPRPL